MRLFSYVVTRDYGFAPNPFYGTCTLATCKPKIRRTASVGDWIVGLTSAAGGAPQSIVYVMRVSEKLSFNDYWKDPHFERKRPNLRGSLKQAFGDNIYFQEADGRWVQRDSHHSHPGGRENRANVERDTSANSVLVGNEFAYWGRGGPPIPERIDGYPGQMLCVGHGHRCQFASSFVVAVVQWFRSLKVTGYVGAPF